MKDAYNQKQTWWNHRVDIMLYKYPIVTSKPDLNITQEEAQALAERNARIKEKHNPRKKYKDMSDEEKSESDTRRKQYYKKRVNYLADLAMHNNLRTFITLTFADEIKDYPKAKKAWELFLKRLKYRLEKDFKTSLKYICVHELQKRRGGVFHFHMLCDLGWYPVDKLQQLWGNGFVYINNIQAIDSETEQKQIRYLFKYISKDINDELEQKQRNSARKIYTSRNLERPDVLTKLTKETVKDVIFNHMENVSAAYSYDIITDRGKVNEVDIVQIIKKQ